MSFRQVQQKPACSEGANPDRNCLTIRIDHVSYSMTRGMHPGRDDTKQGALE